MRLLKQLAKQFSPDKLGAWERAAILPDLGREKAKERGALPQAREIKTPEDLLKRIVLYLTEGKSCGNTSALLYLSESYHLT